MRFNMALYYLLGAVISTVRNKCYGKCDMVHVHEHFLENVK
jgi:hypothetical protein